MLAGVRCCFLLLFLLAFSVAVVLPVQAQVNGVPPSVYIDGLRRESYKRRSPQRDVVRTRRLQQSLVDFAKLLCEFLVAGEPGSTAIFRTPPSPQGWGFSRRGHGASFRSHRCAIRDRRRRGLAPMSTLTRRARRTRILPSDPRGTAIRFRWRTPKRMKKTRRLLSP